MGRKIKITFLLTIVSCLLFGNLTVLAASNSFVKVPSKEFGVITSSGESIDLLSIPALTACSAGVGITSNGLSITLGTTASHVANEIGVKNIILQEKTLFGWKDITIGNDCTYNSDVYSGGYIYTLAQKGTTYRVKCTHYAKFGNSELTLNNTSSEIKYN